MPGPGALVSQERVFGRRVGVGALPCSLPAPTAGPARDVEGNKPTDVGRGGRYGSERGASEPNCVQVRLGHTRPLVEFQGEVIPQLPR